MTDLQVEPEICKPTIAANNFEADTAWPELPAEVVESIASWRRTVGNARSEFAPDILGNAATDLFRTRKIIRTRYPDSDAIVNQEIVDALYDMAETARIDADEAQAIFARAAHTSDAGPAVRNLPVAYPLQAFDNVRLNTACRNYLVKGLLPNSGLAVIWGPPKCGKSFWAFDLGMHVALGRDYRGHRVQQAPVVYIALEGRHGFPARVEAFRRHHGVEFAPFYLLSASLDLVAKSGRLIAAIKAQLGENLPRAIFLDTLNRSLVGSESKDEDMARFLAAAEKVAQELNCVVVIVHHCGIDASRPRGHTGLSGAVESQLKVERAVSGEVIVTVELAKDFAEGTEIVSRLERVELGTDIDGDPITSLVVVAAEASPSTRNITRRLSDRQRLALAALDECAAVSGQAAPADLQLPARTIVVQLSAWREELYRKGVLDREAKSPREEFKRVRQRLQARSLIGIRDDLVWKA